MNPSDLRKLADFLEKNPEVKPYIGNRCYCNVPSHRDLLQVAARYGPVVMSEDDTDFCATKSFGDVAIVWFTTRFPNPPRRTHCIQRIKEIPTNAGN